jgi:hypothetical protein
MPSKPILSVVETTNDHYGPLSCLLRTNPKLLASENLNSSSGLLQLQGSFLAPKPRIKQEKTKTSQYPQASFAQNNPF